MAIDKEKTVLFWSGGKDSAMCLHELRRSGDYDVVALVTAVYEAEQCVTMHRVSRELIEAQAQAIGLPVCLIDVPKACTNVVYLERINTLLADFQQQGVHKVAFGDLFLDDIRDFREEHLEKLGMGAIFPLWHRDTKDLSRQIINAKFKAVLTCVDERSLSQDFVGRAYDRSLLADLPLGVDPCGENGEFHTFVYDGPIFKHALGVKNGPVNSDAGFHYCYIAPRKSPASRTSSVKNRTNLKHSFKSAKSS